MRLASLYLKPHPALLFQINAQLFYIFGSFFFAAKPRYMPYWLTLIVFCMTIDGVYRYFATNKEKIVLWNFSVWAIVNSCVVNMEVYSWFGVFVVGFFAMASKWFLLDGRGRHVFNPSAVAVVIATVLFPSTVSAAGTSWAGHWGLPLAVLTVGGLAAWKAGTLSVVLAYFGGFALVSTAYSLLGAKFGLLPHWEVASVPPLFWAGTLVSVGSMIFMFGVISDPMTAPRGVRNQILFGLFMAVMDYILRRNFIIMADLFAYLITQAARVFLRDWNLYPVRMPALLPNLSRQGT